MDDSNYLPASDILGSFTFTVLVVWYDLIEGVPITDDRDDDISVPDLFLPTALILAVAIASFSLAFYSRLLSSIWLPRVMPIWSRSDCFCSENEDPF